MPKTKVKNEYPTHIPLFVYNIAVEAHKNTLDLLKIVQEDKKQLKEELEAAQKEIYRLRSIYEPNNN